MSANTLVQHGIVHALHDVSALLDLLMATVDGQDLSRPGVDDQLHRVARMARERVDAIAEAAASTEDDMRF
ncbi:hypothetical protein IP87_15680 [beta proteobacterium AAP121]|nr:hypothetical protein IP80_14970 [beta proteobacterium AAP65]KPF95817.1 hypothetical protein IP87_15680 [beta proteobacterium AAP121]